MAAQEQKQKESSVVGGIAEGAAKKKVVEKAVATTGAKIAGAPLGPVGVALASVVVGKLYDVVSSIKAKITGNKSGLSGIIGGALLLGGLAIGGPVGGAVAFGGVMTGVGAMSAISTGVTTLGIGAAFLAGITLITTFVITSLVGGFIFLVFLTALIIFIINAGAFVVPPGENLNSAVPGDVIIGEPAEGVCLPASGSIVGLPFCESDSFTHCPNRLNAYDIANAAGTPIYAVHDGIASSIPDDPSETNRDQGYGNHIIIRGAGLITLYGHTLPNSIIPPGTSREVKAGDLIGLMDNTGRSRGNHVHFEQLSPRGEHISIRFGSVTIGQQVQNCFGL